MIEQHDFQDSVLFLSVYGYMLIEFSFLLNPRYPRALKASKYKRAKPYWKEKNYDVFLKSFHQVLRIKTIDISFKTFCPCICKENILFVYLLA